MGERNKQKDQWGALWRPNRFKSFLLRGQAAALLRDERAPGVGPRPRGARRVYNRALGWTLDHYRKARAGSWKHRPMAAFGAKRKFGLHF